MFAFEPQLGEPGAPERQRKAHPDAVGARARAVDDLGDAHVETTIERERALAQPLDDGRAPAIAERERSTVLDDVARVLGEERLQSRPAVGDVRHFERTRVVEESLEIGHAPSLHGPVMPAAPIPWKLHITRN